MGYHFVREGSAPCGPASGVLWGPGARDPRLLSIFTRIEPFRFHLMEPVRVHRNGATLFSR